jgi:hypothetical protein
LPAKAAGAADELVHPAKSEYCACSTRLPKVPRRRAKCLLAVPNPFPAMRKRRGRGADYCALPRYELAGPSGADCDGLGGPAAYGLDELWANAGHSVDQRIFMQLTKRSCRSYGVRHRSRAVVRSGLVGDFSTVNAKQPCTISEPCTRPWAGLRTGSAGASRWARCDGSRPGTSTLGSAGASPSPAGPARREPSRVGLARLGGCPALPELESRKAYGGGLR